MTEKTAERLNKLLKLAAPVVIVPPAGNRLLTVSGGGLTDAQIKDLVAPVLRRHQAAGMAAEVAAAARGRRPAEIHCDLAHNAGYGAQSSWWWGSANNTLQAAILEAARAELVGVLEAHNARTLAEYERYRVACEQGVAVPPDGKGS